MSLYLALHFPLLPLEVRYGHASSGPAALSAPRRPEIQLCNQAAREEGVAPGQSIASALARCPELQLLSPCPSATRTQWQALALWAGNFSARVALIPPSGLLLEVASMERYFGSLQQLYQRLQDELQSLQFSTTSATGISPESARLLALDNRGLCTDLQQLQHQIAALPVTRLALPERQQQQLTGMGLVRVQQLLELPRQELAQRFAPALTDYLDRLCGRRSDPPRYLEPPPEFQRHQILNHEIEHVEALLFPLRRLLAELEGYLRQTQLQAEALLLTLHQRDQHRQQLTLNHRCGEQRSEHWLELWRLRLERETLTQPVIELSLQATRLRPTAPPDDDLFRRHRGEEPAQLLARLQTRLGHDAVQGLALAEDHRPEQAWQPTVPTSDMAAPASPDGRRHPPPRPAWLLQQPQPLPASPPELQIELLSGPERISSGWWQQWLRRDYYLGRWPDGRLGWLFRDDRQRWHLHGWFG